jgi:hypothetical protein
MAQGAAAVCEHCGATLRAESFYCPECGKATEVPTPAINRKHTVLGVMPSLSVPERRVKPDAAAPPQDRTTDVGLSDPPPGQLGRTMLGMPNLTKVEGGATPAAAPAVPEVVAEVVSTATPGKVSPKTMLGMPGVGVPAAASAAAAKPAQGGARTLIGGPEVMAASQAAIAAARAQQASNAASSDAQASAPARAPNTSHTLLGLEDDAPKVVTAATPAARASTPAERARDSRPRGSRPSDYSVRRAPSPVVLVIAALALGAAAVLGYLALRRHAPDVSVRVTSDANGESMLFEVPAAAAGAKIRFGGQEKALAAGRASFPLGNDSLRVGKNKVLYDLVQASGEVESGQIVLAVDYRVTLDTAPLRAGKPAVDVVVSALPGSKVWLDGEAIALDGQGHAVRSDPLEVGTATGRVDHVVKYRVEPPSGEPTVGELRTTIAVTMMQIDAPGSLVVTDRDSVEIMGAVDKDARVTIDDQPVSVVSGRFRYVYPLPHAGDFLPRIVAMAEGKAPHSVALLVQRVDDLAKAAQGFAPDAALTYTKIVQNTAMYKGQRVAFEGRIYNAHVEGGRSALQILVRECPRGERCPLWVSYPAATEFTKDDWVRVLGVLQGEQQFRADDDQVRSVPKLEAVFLLPAKP